MVPNLQNGDILGDRYRIVSLLGQGGMGNVYLAEDLKLAGKKWAVKESFHLPANSEQFIAEAELLIRLNHPYLPNIIDYYSPNFQGYAYLVMDYIRGSTLMQKFTEHKQSMPVPEVVGIALQLCDVFHYLHHISPSPIIYRDLKPSNVMLDEQGNVRLIDFGIARNLKRHQQADTLQIGTIGFAAPEQFELLQTDPRTDLYSLGALMYFLLSGGNYFYMTEKPLEETGIKLPDRLMNVVGRLLKHDPAERFQNALEVRQELQGVLDSDHYRRTANSRISGWSAGHSRRMIAFCSLYPGAGSTFAVLSMAKALSLSSIPNAVVEWPYNEPELYQLLFGERNAPRDYRFLLDQICSGCPPELHVPWIDDFTEWYPVHPDGKKGAWRETDVLKMLHAVKAPATLVDVSHHWNIPEAEALFQLADALVFVVDPFPAKMNGSQSLQMLGKINGYRNSGKNVYIVANRDLPIRMRREWISSLPFAPACFLPDIPFADIMEAVWKGRLVQDRPDVMRKLSVALSPLIEDAAPADLFQYRRGRAEKYRKIFFKLQK
ncbi:serine/threonine protein kinase [Ferviditalea candida]|uniref:non-specific serine/threonine protein kinase n=1 Tax=Ferviditalea candida TaxID=3108399 RepID=A0ABU5ZJK7_9BACL|nr:protein kinase [Paenibacillaceae bacterium T2]